MPETCLGCGCTCDDIEVTTGGGRIVEARHACALGVAWFGDGRVPSRVLAAGRDVALMEALDAAAALLVSARRPLVYLAPDISCETQREAIGIADFLRAAVDSPTSATAMASILAAQELGRAGATLGEIRNRADVLVFWGIDPTERYPRYWSRYAPEPAGVHVPGGRGARTVIAVDIGDARGPVDADRRVAIHPDLEVAALTRLRAAVLDPDADRLDPSSHAAPAPEPVDVHRSGQRLLEPVLRVLLGARYVAFVADAEPDRSDRDPGRAAALVAVTQALNSRTRAALSTLRAGGNRSGADAWATSQTGYPAAIDFSRGYPRYRPHDGSTRARLSRGDVDAVLVIGSSAAIPPDIAAGVARLPCVAIGPRASDGPLAAARVVIDTGVAGIHEGGTALRMDDVPLPLGAPLGGPPPAREAVAGLRARLAGR
jgi:formylmethanofuran dehydrogenase subunit B